MGEAQSVGAPSNRVVRLPSPGGPAVYYVRVAVREWTQAGALRIRYERWGPYPTESEAARVRDEIEASRAARAAPADGRGNASGVGDGGV